MAWEPKHRGEFTDIQGLYWRADIEEDAYGGDVMKLKFAGIPLMIEFLSTDDDPFNPIRGTKVDLTFYSDTDFQYVELYSVDNLQFRVKIYDNDDSLYFVGYVIVGNYEEPYEGVSYAVTVSAACGLGILKDIEYKDEGEYYNGRILESQIILDILGKIGHTEFKEFVNLYDVGMDVTVDDSPFDQIMIDVDIFQDMNCWEVLNHILSKYNAFIRQRNGIFEIIRPVELVANAVYGRYFTAATVKTPVSFTANQYIKRVATHPSETTLQVPGGALMIQGPASKVISTQDYGNKDSWIDNYRFDGKTFDEATGDFDYWTRSTAMSVNHVSFVIPGEREGCLFPVPNIYPNYVDHIYQIFGQNAIASGTDEFGLELEFMFYNIGEDLEENVVFYAEIKDVAETYWLIVEGQELEFGNAYWDTNQAYIRFASHSPPGLTQWITLKRKVPALPCDGPFKISIFAVRDYTPGIYGIIKNFKFYAYSSELSQYSSTRMVPYQRKKFLGIFWSKMREKEIYYFPMVPRTVIEKVYEKENPINGETLERDYILGDVIDSDIENVAEQMAGALTLSDLTPTTAWSTRGGSESQPLIELITDEIADQYSRPKQLIQMSLFETAEALAINVNANMQDDKNTYKGDTRVFSVNKGEFDVRNRAWMLDLLEIGAKTPASEEGGPGGVTVDSTIITVDSTIITSDNE